MKRSPLRRKKPMARQPMRRGKKRSAYATRERDTEHMLAVKQLPCYAQGLSPCEGPIEADHAGARGIGRKASDKTVIPLCTLHHAQRGSFSGPFRSWNQERMRQWLYDALVATGIRLAGGVVMRRSSLW